VTTPLAGCLPSWRFYLMTSNFRLNHRGFRGYRFPFGFSRSLPTALRHLWSPYLMACRSSEARVFAVTSPLVERSITSAKAEVTSAFECGLVCLAEGQSAQPARHHYWYRPYPLAVACPTKFYRCSDYDDYLVTSSLQASLRPRGPHRHNRPVFRNLKSFPGLQPATGFHHASALV
jgi:hypothetical protein